VLTAMLQGEIITTGTELLTGRVAEQNGRYAARRLHQAAIPVQCLTVLGDGAPLFGETLRRAVQRSRFVIITGGLGPTDDDLTVDQAAQALGLRLVLHEGLLARIRRCLKERGLPWQEHFARLALIPEGALILDPGGQACGFSLRYEGTWLFFLPGVPREMQALFDAYVLPALVSLGGRRRLTVSRVLRFFGLTEGELQGVVTGLPDVFAGVTVGYYPNFPETHLALTLQGENRADLEATLNRAVERLAREVGDRLLGPEDVPLEELVGLRLREQNHTLAVAESCSGGLICHRLTNISGASDYFLGGVVTYSNQAKIDLLGVSPEILREKGAVSAETAYAMAQGVQRLFKAHYTLAATGIAGPSGGTPAKPVGTVFLGLGTPTHTYTRECHFNGDRSMIKTLTAETALDWLRRELGK
jgi:nicotinamide-nucleotide amidase